jgi:hypothetical protein
VVTGSAEGLETSEHVTVTKNAESDRSRTRSRSTLSGSQRGHILPLSRLNSKGHESGDAAM